MNQEALIDVLFSLLIVLRLIGGTNSMLLEVLSFGLQVLFPLRKFSIYCLVMAWFRIIFWCAKVDNPFMDLCGLLQSLLMYL